MSASLANVCPGIAFSPYQSLIDLTPDVLHAVDPTRTPPPIATRLAGVSCVTFAMIIHGTRPAWGVRLQNSLGVLKLIALCAIALSGLAALARLPGFKLEEVRSH